MPTLVKMLQLRASLVAQIVNSLPAMQEIRVWSLGREDPLEWQPTPVFLPEEFSEHRSLAGCSPWSHKELGMTQWLTLSLSFTRTEAKANSKWFCKNTSTIQSPQQSPLWGGKHWDNVTLRTLRTIQGSDLLWGRIGRCNHQEKQHV